MKTAREWCGTYNLTAAINAGMYNDDYRTHTGYLSDNNHVNSRLLTPYTNITTKQNILIPLC